MRHAMAAVILGLGAGAAQAEVPRVAVDIAPVHSIVAAVMGDLGTPSLITPVGASPHDHQLRPSEARALDEADIIVWVGHALTPWLEGPVETLGADAVTLELMDRPDTFLLETRTGAAFGAHDHDHGHDAHEEAEHEDHAAHAHDDHAHEDHADAHDSHASHDADDGPADHAAHGPIDPHVWLAPENAATWAQGIAATLSQHDPRNAAIYSANTDAFVAELRALEAELEAMLEAVQARPFVVFHDAYHYFEHRFEVEALGAVSTNDATAPSAGRMAELQDAIAATDAICALTEPQFNPGLLNALGPVKLGEIDPLGAALEPGPGLYPNLLRNMGRALADCLS